MSASGADFQTAKAGRDHDSSATVERCCFGCRSREGGIFSGLDSSSLTELDRLRQTTVFPAGVVIYAETEAPRAAYCVCSGRIKLTRDSEDGRSVVFGIATSGSLLGARALLLGELHDHTAETVEPTRVCYIPQKDFLSFLSRDAGVTLRLARKLCLELGDAYRQVYSLALKPVAVRLAELLLELCQTHGEPTSSGVMLKTNLCQHELAELVGVSRRSLSRALGALKDQGLIECRRRFILVRDLAALGNCLSSLS